MRFIVLQDFFVWTEWTISNYQYSLIALASLTGTIELYYNIVDIIMVIFTSNINRIQPNMNIHPISFPDNLTPSQLYVLK